MEKNSWNDHMLVGVNSALIYEELIKSGSFVLPSPEASEAEALGPNRFYFSTWQNILS